MAELEWFDWGDAADQASVGRLDVILALRASWPTNDRARIPSRSKDMDRLMREDPTVPGRVREIIEGLAKRGRREAI